MKTIKKTLKNLEMVNMVRQLQPLLSHKDLFGYVAARNTRILTEQLTEYDRVQREMLERFGKEKAGKNGVTELVIEVNTPEFKQFCEAMEPFAGIEHEVELMTMKYEDTIGCLSGEEILALEWMLEE